MKLPNGYGSITKLSGPRRNPYMVRITVGYDDFGRQIRKILGYFPKRSEALAALAEYEKCPTDLERRNITFSDVYERLTIKSQDINKLFLKKYINNSVNQKTA